MHFLNTFPSGWVAFAATPAASAGIYWHCVFSCYKLPMSCGHATCKGCFDWRNYKRNKNENVPPSRRGETEFYGPPGRDCISSLYLQPTHQGRPLIPTHNQSPLKPLHAASTLICQRSSLASIWGLVRGIQYRLGSPYRAGARGSGYLTTRLNLSWLGESRDAEGPLQEEPIFSATVTWLHRMEVHTTGGNNGCC